MMFNRLVLGVCGMTLVLAGLTGCDPVPRRTLTTEEKLADLAWVYSQFGQNYAPLEYKEKRFGFNYEKLKLDTNDAAKLTTTNDEFYAVVFKFVSNFKDAHSSAALTAASLPNRSMVAYLGFSGVRNGETLLVKSLLPTIAKGSAYPIQVGDKILKLDGKLLRDVVQAEQIQWRNLGNDEANFTYHVNKLFTRVSTSNGIPTANDAVLTVKRGSDIHTITLPWVKKDVVQFQAEQQKATDAAKKTTKTENYVMLAQSAGEPLFKFNFLGFDGRIELPVLTADLISRGLRRSVDEGFRFVDAFASWQFMEQDAKDTDAAEQTSEQLLRTQRYVPETAVFLTEAKVYPAYVSREKLYDKATGAPTGATTLVGTIYLDTFSPAEAASKTLSEFKSTLESFQLLGVESVVIDLLNNGGGSLALGMALAQALSPSQIDLPRIQLRTSDSWMDQFESDSLSANNDAERELSRRVLADLSVSRRAGTLLSPIYSADILAPYQFQPNDKLKQKFKVAVLINEMCASMCDIFSANLQDNGMATVVGTRSMGAGGNVVGYNQAPNSHFDVRQTESLIVRKDGSYVENEGTKPDVAISVADYSHTKFKEVREAALKALLTK